MSAPRLTITIDRLRVNAATQGDAAALAEGLRTALHAQLSTMLATGGGAIPGQNMPHLSLKMPLVAGQGPAAVGRQAGQQIASALSRPKGGR